MLRPISVAVVAFALLLAAPRAVPQSTPAQAIKQARAASKLALAEHKQRTTQAREALEASLDALVAGLEADQFGNTLLQTFLDSAHAFQLEVGDATEVADMAIAQAFTDALAGLATAQGAAFDGAFPPGFHGGDGGAFDDEQAALRKAVGKLYAKVRKAGEAAIKQARASGVGLTLQFFEPPRRGFFVPDEGEEALGTFHNEVLVSFVAGASRLDTVHDGRMLVCGTGLFVVGDVTIVLFTDGFGQEIVQTTPAGFPGLGGEWSLLVDAEGKGLAEGNYIVDAGFDGALTTADAGAGIP